MFGIYAVFLVILVVAIYFGVAALRKSGIRDEEALLAHCRNDQEQASRLIAQEWRRNPNLSRNAAARAAMQSLRRDSR